MGQAIEPIELGEVCERIGVGLAIAVTPYMADVGVKLIRNQNIRPNKFDASSVVYLDPDFALSQESKTIRAGDVVIVRTGANIGDACVVPGDFDGAQSFTTLVVRTDKNKLQPEFLAQYINSDFGRAEVERLMAGGGKGNLNSGELEKLRIRLLPMWQQEYAAEVLGIWDSAVEKTERLIDELENRFAWSCKKIYARKKHWSECRLKDFFIETKTFHGDGDFLIGSIGKKGIRPRNEVYSKDLSESHEKNILVKKDCICFGLASDSIAYGVNLTDTVYSVSPAYRTFKIGGVDPRFLDNYLRVFNKRLSKKYLITSARQGKSIDFDGLLHEPCYFPSLQEQQEISTNIGFMQKELNVLQGLLEQYKYQKRGLMKRLLTGKVSVRDPEEVAA